VTKLEENRERGIIWLFDSKRQLMTFPKEVRTQVGYALSEAQMGRKADYSKPMTGLGSGVFEIVADHDGDTYRSVYAVKLGEEIYVLHSFQKKSTIGIKTPKPDLDLIKARLSRVKQHLTQANKGQKRKKK
jgi:phage-related protein